MSSNGAFQFGRPSGVRFAEITDGLSNTILVGEKHVALNKFGIGWCDCSTYNGDYPTCSGRAGGPNFPLAATLDDPGWKFGSYHTGVVQFAMGDGGVRRLSVTIDPSTLALLCDRADGQVIPDYGQ